MTTNGIRREERTDDDRHDNDLELELEPRDVRALTDYLLVVEEAPDLYLVYGEGGDECTVDTRTDACTCPDHEYRGVTCKHARRVAFETGARDVPAWAGRDAMDPLLVDALEERDREAATDDIQASAIATDGGILVASDDGEILEPAFTATSRRRNRAASRTSGAKAAVASCLRGSADGTRSSTPKTARTRTRTAGRRRRRGVADVRRVRPLRRDHARRPPVDRRRRAARALPRLLGGRRRPRRRPSPRQHSFRRRRPRRRARS
ncbi:SWIM zinc finger family protein [Halomarina pelagica]|uniref:SWIM zinc finger family protein n=1 Tax=Halomarina pelagica TaxID=2961599 RepID=UPI0020C518FA|nr:SWIM zinc finger family protein [Halomarina sp. BND7]